MRNTRNIKNIRLIVKKYYLLLKNYIFVADIIIEINQLLYYNTKMFVVKTIIIIIFSYTRLSRL